MPVNPPEFTSEQLEAIILKGLEVGDMEGVVLALRVMVGVDPRRAIEIYDEIQVGMRFARKARA